MGIRSFAQIAQIKWVTVSDSLRSIRKNGWLWANRSGRLWQMSHCDQFAQVAHYKWANGRIPHFFRVGHRILFCSERSVLFRSFKECNVLLHSFFEVLAPYETQKNNAFISVLFLRTEKNATFFCKERKRTKRMFHSSAKNVKECENVSFFCKRT